jgi:hypothetical protein
LALLVWVGQTLFLTLSSVLRLELYVEAFGLTRWRFAALLWMGLVAAGLALMLWQIARRHAARWMILRSGLLGLATLYAASLINVDGVIARTNLAREGQALDPWYLCSLSEGALPAILAWERDNGLTLCAGYDRPYLTSPDDWREWGYRNHRLRHSLPPATDRPEPVTQDS